MNREQAVADLTNVMSKFTAYIAKPLPTDVPHNPAASRKNEATLPPKKA